MTPNLRATAQILNALLHIFSHQGAIKSIVLMPVPNPPKENLSASGGLNMARIGEPHASRSNLLEARDQQQRQVSEAKSVVGLNRTKTIERRRKNATVQTQ